MTKIIAFHLPQFHTFPENDEWWGKGFTEWTNTKKAKPLFNNHNQPREPLNDNYYNMLEYKTRKWQADLAKTYGVHGFCYYHYWFNGKLLMEKPLELLLEEKDIDLPFCLCWANEPWTKAWDGKEKNIIMAQEYGGKEEWKKHYEYLKQFFKDSRYIKVDNRPMFILYRTSSIDNCDEMIEFWDKCCAEDGFSGIHIVEEFNSFQKESFCKQSKATLDFEPMHTTSNFITTSEKITTILRKIKGKVIGKRVPDFYDYDKVWKQIIERKVTIIDKKIYLGAFVDWDNSARKGNRSTIFKGSTPEKFENYLEQQMKKASDINSDYLFINAWNEWAEGTYLEPDKRNGYKYLGAIKNVTEKLEK